MLTHRPKNPFCEVCARTRARQVYRRRGSFRHELHARGELATARGYALDADDRLRAFVIERLMCDFALSTDALRNTFGDRAAQRIGEEIDAVLADDPDGLVERTPQGLRMTERGRPFVRSICARFDAYLSPEPGVIRHAMAI